MRTSTAFRVVLPAIVLAAAGIALGGLHLENARLRRQLDAVRQSQRQTAALREDNARLGALLEKREDAAATASLAREQLAQARREIAELEQRAAALQAERTAQAARAAAELAHNRDPRSGLTRLEHFQNRGQGTPAAAFESMVAAAIKGDEAALAQLCTLPAAARERAKALIARLPAEAQEQWTPEKLAILWGTGALTEISALQVTDETFSDAQHAVVTFRTSARDEERVKLTLGRGGWRVVVPASAIERLEKKLRPSPSESGVGR